MAGHTGILATSNQITYLAGANVNATYVAEAYVNVYVALAEGLINTATRFNWCDVYAGLDSDVQGVLAMATSAKTAQMIIQADPSGMPSREAETRLDYLENLFQNCIEVLRDIKNREWVKDQT